MVNILNKSHCVGCGACQQVCGKSCIKLRQDAEGFLYPQIDESNCINCSHCNKVCPVENQGTAPRIPKLLLGAKCKIETLRKQSSSGGVFSLLANWIIEEQGIVFGAKFNENWEIVHGYCEDKEGIVQFQGSKYVQSFIGESFKQVKEFLKQDRWVLFSGTPCQIAGLKLFLRKKYEKLLTVDFICHGTPSPLVWNIYKKNLIHADEKIHSISFRDKSLGWRNFSFTCVKEIDGKCEKWIQPLSENVFLRGFLNDLYLRPSCHHCPVRNLSSGSDITLSDFWGIEVAFPQYDDNKGHSIVLLNSDLGKYSYENIRKYVSDFEISYEMVRRFNKAVHSSVKAHKNREYFFKELSTHNIADLIEKCLKVNVIDKVCLFVKRIIRKMENLIKIII